MKRQFIKSVCIVASALALAASLGMSMPVSATSATPVVWMTMTGNPIASMTVDATRVYANDGTYYNSANGEYNGSGDFGGTGLAESGDFLYSCTPGQSPNVYPLVRKLEKDNLTGFSWSKEVSSDYRDSARALALDASYVYVLGEVYSTIDGQTSQGGVDVFLKKYDAVNGRLDWTCRFGSSFSDRANGVATDGTWVYVVSEFSSGEVTNGILSVIDGATGTRRNLALHDPPKCVAVYDNWVYVAGPGFVTKFNKILYSQVWTADFHGDAYAIAVDACGIFVAGEATDTGMGAVVCKYDFEGNLVWTYEFGDVSGAARSISLDATAIYLAGQCYGVGGFIAKLTKPAASTTAVTSSANPTTFGQTVTFTAAVTAATGTPTGTVDFKDGNTVIASAVELSDGIATFTTSSLAVGEHSITAIYSGDFSFCPSISSSLTQRVVYNFSGFLPPIGADGGSVFKLGSTVPVKFQLTDYTGSFVTDAVATIVLNKVSDGVLGDDVEAVSTVAASTGNLFRYDSTANQYIFNLGTKTLSVGTWQVKVLVGDGTAATAQISLKK